MTSAKRKRKSRENKLVKISEDEKLGFKAKERERSEKAMPAKRLKERENRTPQELHDCKQEEAARIKALRNTKRTSTQQRSKEKAKALHERASTKHKNSYKRQQSFSKAINKVRADLSSS